MPTEATNPVSADDHAATKSNSNSDAKSSTETKKRFNPRRRNNKASGADNTPLSSTTNPPMDDTAVATDTAKTATDTATDTAKTATATATDTDIVDDHVAKKQARRQRRGPPKVTTNPTTTTNTPADTNTQPTTTTAAADVKKPAKQPAIPMDATNENDNATRNGNGNPAGVETKKQARRQRRPPKTKPNPDVVLTNPNVVLDKPMADVVMEEPVVAVQDAAMDSKTRRRQKRRGQQHPSETMEDAADATAATATDFQEDYKPSDDAVTVAPKRKPRQRRRAGKPSAVDSSEPTTNNNAKDDVAMETTDEEDKMDATEQPPTGTPTNPRQRRRGKRMLASAAAGSTAGVVAAESAPETTTDDEAIIKPRINRRQKRRAAARNVAKDKDKDDDAMDTTEEEPKGSPRKRNQKLFIRTRLGDLWTTDAATKANFRTSNNDEDELNVTFRNATEVENVYLCWMDSKGTPQNYDPLPPLESHEEKVSTTVGHVFCYAVCKDVEQCKQDKTVDTILAAYRPRVPNKDVWEYQIVTLVESTQEDATAPPSYTVLVKTAEFPKVPVDSTQKHYDSMVLGGWPVRVEPGCWEDATCKQKYEEGLAAVCKYLPEHAREALVKTTPIYINLQLTYGPSIRGTHMCFHPYVEWLVEMGCSPEKQGSVEVYQCVENLQDVDDWGVGGSFLHEICHAYHFKSLEGGYENAEIAECYQLAMKEKLYEKVSFHGGNGKPAKAYACTDPMEYFAELSVAFLGGLDSEQEYNKWFPYNRSQVKEHDPRMYELLKKLWEVECD